MRLLICGLFVATMALVVGCSSKCCECSKAVGAADECSCYGCPCAKGGECTCTKETCDKAGCKCNKFKKD